MLIWGDSNCPLLDHLDQFSQKKGLQLTTWPHNMENLRSLDVVFSESIPIYNQLRLNGIRTVLGFGTDTNFFKPNESVVKDIPYFFPGTFSPWKNQQIIAGLGASLYCIGTIQPDGKVQWEALEKAGAHLAQGYFPPKEILKCYQRARNVIIPAIHGSERTVLEAMSCNILPHVVGNNERAGSFVEEFKQWLEINGKWTRDFVIERYSEKTYANALEKGLNG
jgi:hypothetical protein